MPNSLTKCTKQKPQTTLSSKHSPTLAAFVSTSISNNPSTDKNNDNDDFEHIEKKSDWAAATLDMKSWRTSYCIEESRTIHVKLYKPFTYLPKNTTSFSCPDVHGLLLVLNNMCSLINDLIIEDEVNPKQILSILNRMANHLRVPVEGSVSDQSTNQIVQEGCKLLNV